MGPLDDLTRRLNKFPGIGKKTAQKLVFHILEMDDLEVENLSKSIINVKKNVKRCRICQNYTDSEVCDICKDRSRNHRVICVVESARDVEVMERSRAYKGVYHVLHGQISPLRGMMPENVRIKELISRVKKNRIDELIIASNPNPDGEATALYIKNKMAPFGIKISRIGYGLPFGGNLEYYDEITISTALSNRKVLE